MRERFTALKNSTARPVECGNRAIAGDGDWPTKRSWSTNTSGNRLDELGKNCHSFSRDSDECG